MLVSLSSLSFLLLIMVQTRAQAKLENQARLLATSLKYFKPELTRFQVDFNNRMDILVTKIHYAEATFSPEYYESFPEERDFDNTAKLLSSMHDELIRFRLFHLQDFDWMIQYLSEIQIKFDKINHKM